VSAMWSPPHLYLDLDSIVGSFRQLQAANRPQDDKRQTTDTVTSPTQWQAWDLAGSGR
jgi:hypothetical protein